MAKLSIPVITLAALLLAACQKSAANPWLGAWSLRAQDADGKPETLIYSDAGNGAMRMESVEAHSVILTRFDGQPAPDTGGSPGPPRTLAVKATSPTTYTWTFALDGKPFVQGLNTLAADGQSFTEVSWRVGKPEKTATLVYERRK